MKKICIISVIACCFPLILAATPPTSDLNISAIHTQNNNIQLLNPKQQPATNNKIMTTKLINIVETQQTLGPWQVICATKKSDQQTSQSTNQQASKPFKYCSAAQTTQVKLVGLTITVTLSVTPLVTTLDIENAIPTNKTAQLAIGPQKPIILHAICENLPTKQGCILLPKQKTIKLDNQLDQANPTDKIKLTFVDQNTNLPITANLSMENYDQISNMMQESRTAVKQEFAHIFKDEPAQKK